MNFQGALTLLKEGKKLRRKAWLFFGYVSRHADGFAIHGSLQGDYTAWKPTHQDLFADDWEIFTFEPEYVELSGLTGRLRFHNGFFEWSDPTGACRVTIRDLAEALRYAKPIARQR
jgi:hypothetical protein